MLARARSVVGEIKRTQARVAARDKQLVAWAHMLGESTVKRTKRALHVLDALRIAGYAFIVMGVVKQNAHEENLALAVAAMIIGWIALSAAHLGLRDAILARAFATMTPAGANAAPAPVVPRVVLSAAAEAAVRRARQPPPPRARPKPAVTLAPIDDDRDAVDFDDAADADAVSGPPSN